MPLGATHGRVIGLVVREGARLIALGLLIGVPGVYMSDEALRGFLIGVSPFDVWAVGAVVMGMIFIALLACYLAARRVTRIAADHLLREGG
jgi:putative ABC transport system permease protein